VNNAWGCWRRWSLGNQDLSFRRPVQIESIRPQPMESGEGVHTAVQSFIPLECRFDPFPDSDAFHEPLIGRSAVSIAK
jgi:hypothetical protein